jgi:hypothetical protein
MQLEIRNHLDHIEWLNNIKIKQLLVLEEVLVQFLNSISQNTI